MMPKLDISQRFLLECARAGSAGELENTAASFSKISAAIQWQEEIDHNFGMTLGAYLRLKDRCKDFNIPGHISELIDAKYASNIMSNTAALRKAAGLSRKFEAAGIDAIFIKGAALLATVYRQDIGKRFLGDIDVLVRKEHLVQAEKVLFEDGYKDLYSKQERDNHLKRFCHLQYGKGDDFVELHWDMTHDIIAGKNIILARPLGKEALTELSKAAIKVSAGGGEFKILDPSGEIFAACCHFNKHWIFNDHFEIRFRTKKDIASQNIDSFLNISYDLKQMLSYYGANIDWGRFLTLAKAADNEFEAFTMLYLAGKVFGFPVPESMAGRIRQDRYSMLYISLSRGLKHYDLPMLLAIRRTVFDFRQAALWLKRPGTSLKNWAYFMRSAFFILGGFISIFVYAALRPRQAIKQGMNM